MEAPIAFDSLCLGGLPARHARYRPRHTAVVVCGRTADERELRLDWRAFNAYVNRWAHALTGLRVARGDRVATVLPNGLELLATYWACAKLGAAAVPLSPLLTATGLESLLRDAAPRVVVTTDDHLPATRDPSAPCAWVLVDAVAGGGGHDVHAFATLHAAAAATEPGAEVAATDLLTLMYTSGTTGLPKGIPHTHFIRAMYALTMANAWRLAPESVVLHTGALIFNGAMVMMFPAFLCGATFILHRAFDPEQFIATVERERVTHTMLVPSQIIALLNAPGFAAARLASLETVLSLGAPLHNEYKDRLNRLLPDRFYELYGLTEGFVTILDRDDARRKSGSVGVPPPFYAMRILGEDGREVPPGEVGEIVGRGPITMPGYYRQPDLTATALAGGWLHSGDLGYVDEEGYLYLVDRKKDMIDSGGVKVYPKDIEEVAARHPAVREVAVFGIPHAKWGETPVAAVLLNPGASVDAEALKDWINARVSARYQRLDRVLILADFPRNAAGKTLKRELREPFWKDRDRRI
jgi:acyl-CoA synthetase (AMP-forming)/AMP-acid ligase II